MFLVRQATESDCPAIAIISSELGYPTTDEQVTRRFAVFRQEPAKHGTYVAVEPHLAAIVGWLHVYGVSLLESDGYAEIGGLIVRKELRRQGLGRALMEAAEKWAMENAYPELRLRSGMHRIDEAHRFYERIGYIPAKQSMMFKKVLPKVEAS